MPLSTSPSDSGLLLVAAILVPVIAVLTALAVGDRGAQRVALTALPIGLGIAVAITSTLLRSGAPIAYFLGGWAPPLGITLRADALSAFMLLLVAVVVSGIAIYACCSFGTPTSAKEARAPFTFWSLLLATWGSLNLLFVSADLFTLYVALELLTFAAVPLVSLDGSGETLRAALRYLLFALLGSVFYLLGTVLLYGGYGTLDIAQLSAGVHAGPLVAAAAALMTAGLLAKTALFPIHLWLPPAHAGAPAAASAILSGLVIKGSWFLVVRLWFGALPASPAGGQLLAALGAAAIVFGSIVALRQERLKLLVAFSTVAQIGYLFLMFPLAFDSAGQIVSGGALTGGVLQAASHATAKAAMFMSAGLIYTALGHDRVGALHGAGRDLPVTVLAFAVAGVALIGVPPSGAYFAKALLLGTAEATAQWWWVVVLQCGPVLTSSYVLLVLWHALRRGREPVARAARVSRVSEVVALALALCSLLLGVFPWDVLLPGSPMALDSLLSLKSLYDALWPVLLGAVVAVLLGHWGHAPASCKPMVRLLAGPRCLGVEIGKSVERADGMLRQWPAACVSLVLIAILLGSAFIAMR